MTKQKLDKANALFMLINDIKQNMQDLEEATAVKGILLSYPGENLRERYLEVSVISFFELKNHLLQQMKERLIDLQQEFDRL